MIFNTLDSIVEGIIEIVALPISYPIERKRQKNANKFWNEFKIKYEQKTGKTYDWVHYSIDMDLYMFSKNHSINEKENWRISRQDIKELLDMDINYNILR